MTTEEKAKAYDEALERAKELIAKWTGKNKDFYTKDYAYIFPELRESEDERIWEAIVREFERASNSYLIETYDLSKDKFLAYLEKQKEPENTSASTMIPSCWETEQKEQKPAEWSEEDEQQTDKVLNDYALGHISSAAVKMWFKSLRPSWKPSEEQMKALESARLMYAHGLEREDIAVILESLQEQLHKLM